ncbi:MAG: hypothetical protein GOVbin7759_21 [Prokaryotic dsDNA virus sp.]|jgi:hypothetical protein|nr:MAG: hypothetical protein GOVbin7759_21 [Prokaryotic dsDNA virus sp.]
MQDNVAQVDAALAKALQSIAADPQFILTDASAVLRHSAHRLASTAQPEVKALVEALEAIKAQTSAEDDAGENYRWDDREGALDFAYATAAQALAAYHEAQP